MATNNLPNNVESNFTCSRPLNNTKFYDKILIYSRDAIEFANTSAFGYFVTSVYNEFNKFRVSGSSGAI